MASVDLLNLNLSVVLQLFIYVVTVLLLARFVFRPALSAVDERTTKTAESEGESEADKRLKKAEQDYMAKLKVVRSEGSKQRGLLRTAALEEEARILASAQQSAHTMMKTTRERVVGEVEEAKKTVSDEIPQLAQEVAERLLGRAV